MRVALLAAWLVAAAAQANPAAWHVTGPGGGQLWLLGSVHYLRDRDHPLPPVVDELYARAEVIVMELDLDDLDPLRSQSQFAAAALLERGVTLRDVLPQELYALAEERAGELGIELAMLERFEPWLVAVTLLDLGMRRLGYRAEQGVEQYLLRKSIADRKEVLGLEALDTQIAVFDELAPTEQQALLAQTLAELGSAEVLMDDLIAAWRAGMLGELGAALMDEFASFPALYEALVVARNTRWISRIEALLEEPEPHLVVVGALHLVGEHNVVDLLAARGWDVRILQ